MADKKFTQLAAAGALTVNDLLAIAQSPFGAGSSKSITGSDLAVFINSIVAGTGAYLPSSGGTLTGNLLFSLDNTRDIGANAATRPRTGYFGTSVISPLFTGSLTGAASLNLLLTGGTLTGNLLFSPDNTLDIGAVGATRPRTLFAGTSVDSPTYRFGGTTSSFPALTRSTTFIDHVLADASGPCQISCGKNAVGVATTTDGLIIKNLTAAVLNAQQNSPALLFRGNGWQTANASRSLEWRMYVVPVQGGTPTSKLVFTSSVEGAAFVDAFSLTNAGALTISSDMTVAAAGAYKWTGRSQITSASDGNITLKDSAGTGDIRLAFSGSTNAFPALRRSTTNLILELADGSALTWLTCGKDGLGASLWPGLLISNQTLSDGATAQWSPSLRLRSGGWTTDTEEPLYGVWDLYADTTIGLNAPVSTLNFRCEVEGQPTYLALTLTPFAATHTGHVWAGTGYVIGWATSTCIKAPSDGILSLLNTAQTGFTRLNFGGTTSSFPAISRSTTNLVLQLADGTGNAGLTTGALTTVACQTHKYLGINAAQILDATHYCVNATANTFDVTLPTAVSVAGRTYVIKNSGTGVVTLKANGAQTIDGVASWTINQYTSLTAMSDGAGWLLI